LDQRIDRGSTAVFSGKLGYSGKCLPKDISAIYNTAMEAGFESNFLKQVIETNKEQRKIDG
jgi:UDP-glucose 6-dehydrogenase